MHAGGGQGGGDEDYEDEDDLYYDDINFATSKIVLFEDFDRYLQEGRHNMSEILNELDGIESTEGVVRFFTANNVQEMMKYDALINRMSAKFEFFMPTMEHFSAKLDRFLTLYPAEWREENKVKIDAFLKLIEVQCVGNLTLRPFSNYVIRYLFDTNCMDLMVEHIAELVYADRVQKKELRKNQGVSKREPATTSDRKPTAGTFFPKGFFCIQQALK
jgi:SpoVK/Ycf46/Vps4 family AAA+-type ATPase